MKVFKAIIIVILISFLSVIAQEIEIFDAQSQKDFLKLIPEKDKEEIISALEDAAGNYKELVNAIKLADEDKKEDLIWLIQRIPHLDRLTITSDILLEHLDYAFESKSKFKYEVPEELFREFILTYRIGSEPVQKWRKTLFEIFYPMVKDKSSPSNAAKAINHWVKDNIRERPREYFGQVQPPLRTLKGKKGTEEEIAILTTAILKSLGIPGRRARVSYFGQEIGGASWVEIYDGGNWVPLYPLNPGDFGDYSKYEKDYQYNITVVFTRSANQRSLITPAYTPAGSLKVCIFEGSQPMIKFEDFSVSVFNDGSLCPLDELFYGYGDEELLTDSAGCFQVELGNGIYWVQAGKRDSLGNPWVVMQKVVVEPEITIELELDITSK
jgi:hypothetical protein